jgi:hypothetical protein
MRVLRVLSFVVFAGLASVLVSVGSAAAQGTANDPSAGNSAIRARSEGSYTPPRFVLPTLAEFRMSLQFVFARYLSLGMLPTRTTDVSNPADLPARRRLL